MLKVASSIDIGEVYLLGDYADFYCVHQHGAKDPRVGQILEKEVSAVIKRLDELDLMFPKAKKYYIIGNHEHRLERFILNNASQLFGYIDLIDVLEIRSRPGWNHVPYSPNQKISISGSKLYARHEPLGSSAQACARKSMCSLVYGHIHRIEEGHITGLDGKSHVVWSPGWLGDVRKDKVFGYVKNTANWQLGFGIVHVNPKTKYFYHQKIHIMPDISCVFNGELFR